MRDDLANLIDSAAYIVYKRHRSHTEPEDIRQEMWVWILAQDPTRVDELEEHKLVWKLRDAGEVYARRERASARGYKPDDEVFYSMRTLRDLLPLAVTTDPEVLRREGEEGAKSSGGDATSMEFETTVADLRRAYKKLSAKYRDILAKHVSDPLGSDDVAVTRALRFMQRKLGGKKPRKDAV